MRRPYYGCFIQEAKNQEQRHRVNDTNKKYRSKSYILNINNLIRIHYILVP